MRTKDEIALNVLEVALDFAKLESAEDLHHALSKLIIELKRLKVNSGYLLSRKLGKLISSLDGVKAEIPIEVSYEFHNGGQVLVLEGLSELISAMSRMGIDVIGSDTRGSQPKVLFGAPIFDGISGPIWDGAKSIVYST